MNYLIHTPSITLGYRVTTGLNQPCFKLVQSLVKNLLEKITTNCINFIQNRDWSTHFYLFGMASYYYLLLSFTTRLECCVLCSTKINCFLTNALVITFIYWRMKSCKSGLSRSVMDGGQNCFWQKVLCSSYVWAMDSFDDLLYQKMLPSYELQTIKLDHFKDNTFKSRLC